MSVPNSEETVLAAYQRRLDELQSRIHELQLQQLHTLIAGLCFAALFVALLFGAWRRQPIFLASASLSLVCVFVAWQKHARFGPQSLELALRAGFYERGLERLEGKCRSDGDSGEEFARPIHLYQNDLNILGAESLFELLCTTRSEAGAERLASYLLDPVEIEEVKARQEAVRELQDATGLREEIALLGDFQFQQCARSTFEDWLNRLILKIIRVLPFFLFLSSATCLILGVLGLAKLVSMSSVLHILLPLLLVQAGVGAAFRERVRPLIQKLNTLTNDFAVLREGLHLLQSQQFRSAKLNSLVQRVRDNRASLRVRKIERLVRAIGQREKELFYAPSLFLIAGTQLVFAVERWRTGHQDSLKGWIDAWAEFDALNALACYAHERPEAVFPELIEDGAVFEAEDLGHPLIPEGSCVRNSVALNQMSRFYVVSGSNMAGKSTFLRTIGINAVLASAGAPVRARRARISPFAVCASISIVDSLLGGRSKFLAEVDRIRESLRCTQGNKPVLFLIDEILSGTNSWDRGVVAESVIRALIEGGAVGALSTHDLALTAIAEMPELRGVNLHMESENPADPLNFNYRVKPGVLHQSNALAIAKMMGVPV